MREALAVLPDVHLDDLGEDNYFPKGRSLLVRGTNRLLRSWHRAELEREIAIRLTALRPDVLMVYKGNGVSADVVRRAHENGVFTVNVFPDYSPHAYGAQLKAAMGEYDLVVSTKPFHPDAWKPIYGYENRCVCVPHGYDPAVHYWADSPSEQDIDVVLAASWRPQYEKLMVELGDALDDANLSVALAGPNWVGRREHLPSHWQFPGALYGRAYGEFVRRGKAVIAPVHSEVFVNGVQQPGDEDTTRTYELASAGCFFLHRRTPFAMRVYDERQEVPMWDDAAELAELIKRYLPQEDARRAMAARAHSRAVPNYSVPARAAEVLKHVADELAMRKEAEDHGGISA
jgi:hypothetical protein